MSRTAWLLLILLSLLWGGSFLTARIAAPSIPPFTLVFVRVLLAAVALNLVLAATGRRLPLDARSLRDFAVMGLLNNVVPFALIFFGTRTIGAGLASILNAMTPIATVLVMHAATTDEKITAPKAVGVAFGFVGVAVLIGAGALAGLGEHLAAELACLGATVSYAFSTLWARRFRGRPPLVTATGQLTMATVVVAPLALIFEDPLALPMPGPDVVAAVLFLALAATALAYVIFFRILTLAGSNVMLVTFLVPVSAILLGVAVLGERLEPRHWAGMLLIMAGLAAIDGRLWRKLTGRS
ncbi:DMT family transporter [Oharaeibacter diazotrophicus]|uniref:Threonine/homoserine efflux transporter RhtA n=1 Tax=Oharaeibacter diazotrophicus TaxID=1920512 RepID=A0A4R6RHI6_9HYPH|nr:DMT family transporter [Oharaeibacter diazotrophicus]TDP85126.1 threonine/homoserine efflux transporter RhtA [Oharaeibacter diazotrophicus]BBE74096.1 putative DMT superfamily transporter innermembrane protein [Pleomorphomonas sp. SM30]GLS76216.1 ABC transporter permease [Oharaeibacter diazotrophicus]